MIPRYVHLGINPIGGGSVITQPRNWNRALEALLIQYGDWFRFGVQNYVIFTAAELPFLANSIKALPGFKPVYFLLTELSGVDYLKANGWMDPKFWQWLQGKRDLQL